MDDVVDWVLNHLQRSLPLTKREMGEQQFSGMLKTYVEGGGPGRWSSDAIEDFALYLFHQRAPTQAVVVALFEMTMRECAWTGLPPLSVGDLQQAPVSKLLAMRVCRHPSARAIELFGGVPETLLDLYPNLRGGEAILLAARSSGVLVLPLSDIELTLLRRLAEPRALADMIDGAGGYCAAFHRLLQLGVIIEA